MEAFVVQTLGVAGETAMIIGKRRSCRDVFEATRI